MPSPLAFYRWSELDRTTYPDLRERVASFEDDGRAGEPRSYPGYPRFPLRRSRPRLFPGLERTLLLRRSARSLGERLPPRGALGRLLRFGHGLTGAGGRGPVPSAGGLQAIELYLVNFAGGWLPAGLYHYDRAGHHLSQVRAGTERRRWREIVPSLELVAGGAFLWVIVGDGARVERKYAERGFRFLLLEAGHLMQNLCLLATSLGLATVPLGGFFEREVQAEFTLPEGDLVLYLGICGSYLRGAGPGRPSGRWKLPGSGGFQSGRSSSVLAT
jgi:SagB-type dehydrogenase family enzyme